MNLFASQIESLIGLPPMPSKEMSSPYRMKIIDLLNGSKEYLAVIEIAKITGASRPAVSRQLRNIPLLKIGYKKMGNRTVVGYKL